MDIKIKPKGASNKLNLPKNLTNNLNPLESVGRNAKGNVSKVVNVKPKSFPKVRKALGWYKNLPYKAKLPLLGLGSVGAYKLGSHVRSQEKANANHRR